ncbi:hypothetical protein ADK91_21325 [Streptomyces sp. XY511]|uniref:hypothetical protein n=1 Tax=Streptomyces sp. XY511 TaxID=1519480 RepID=UPI0006C0F5C6|nr:hypothetical protein [Streptomyces sp. XY511]KOV01947.1 hypothetical protein ADK91_21325 [Streptomyces sp. XY511]
MTETINVPVEAPQANAPDPDPATGTPPAAPAVPQVAHVAGGLPALPLALSGANTTAGLVAAAGLTSGPIVAAVAFTGAVVLGAAVRTTSKTRDSRKDATPTRTATAGGRGRAAAGGRGAGLGRIPSQSRSGRAGRPTSAGKHGARSAPGGAAGGPRLSKGRGRPTVRQRAGQAVGSVGGGRVGQVQRLRNAARTLARTRAAARTQTTADRRQVADARRMAKAAARTARAANAGPVGRVAAKTAGKVAGLHGKAVGGVRAALSRQAASTVAAGRSQVAQAAQRKRVAQLAAPARKTARRALRRSAARFHAQRAGAGLLGAVLGVLGQATTPLGRKLGWGWLQYPGRRLFRWLTARAEAAREARDAEIKARLDAELEDAEAQAAAEQDDEVGDQAQRPGSVISVPPTTGGQMNGTTGFRFEELAAEMEQAAQSYEPDDCMEILAMIERLPEALTSIANIMRILAERSDSEFPLDKVIAEGFSDIHGAVNSAVAVAEDLGPAFRMVHAADIARHEDPRNGLEAEKGWNV